MGAENPERRTQTAKELALRFGVSDRTIRRLIAEPRDEFRARAAARRAHAVDLRTQGLTYAEIADVMECSTGTVGRLLHDARKLAEREDAEGQAQAS
ncbi:MAG: helix-turn-helix domain-containing protein [Janthinobacterium lividum]